MTTTSSPAAAFFDVDETLVTCKTMFSFLEFHSRARGLGPREYEQACALLTDIARSGAGREASNRAYYRLFTGQPVAEVAASGRRWFAAAGGTGLFHEPVRRRLAEHRAAGHLVVLVSGSFHACLDPIAEHVGAHVVLGSEPEVRNGRYTGEVRAVRIGAGKAEAVRRICAERGIAQPETHAYGDHASDLDLLTSVAHPVVVGADPVLLRHVRDNSWQRLEGIDE